MLPTPLSQAPAGVATSSSLSVDSHYPASAPETEIDPLLAHRQKAVQAGLGCIRGLRYALIAEGAALLVLFGLWRLWRIFVHS